MSDVAVSSHTHSCGPLNEAWRVAVWSAVALVLAGSLGDARWREVVAFGVLFGVAAAVDLVEYRLPNELLATAAVVATLSAVRTHSLGGAGCGALLAGAPLLLVHLTRGVGMGDVKAAAVLGLQLGQVRWWAPWAAVATACVAAATTGLVVRRRRLAFGPFLWLGWMSAVVWFVFDGRGA